MTLSLCANYHVQKIDSCAVQEGAEQRDNGRQILLTPRSSLRGQQTSRTSRTGVFSCAAELGIAHAWSFLVIPADSPPEQILFTLDSCSIWCQTEANSDATGECICPSQQQLPHTAQSHAYLVPTYQNPGAHAPATPGIPRHTNNTQLAVTFFHLCAWSCPCCQPSCHVNMVHRSQMADTGSEELCCLGMGRCTTFSACMHVTCLSCIVLKLQAQDATQNFQLCCLRACC